MLLAQMVENALDLPMNPGVHALLREFIGKEQWDEQPEVAAGVYVLADEAGRQALLDEGEIVALTLAGFNDIDPALLVMKQNKINIDGVLYHVVNNERITRYNNSIARVNAPYLRQVEFIEIQSIVTW